MGKHSRHYTDLNPLEGGGSGGGSGKLSPLAYIPPAVGLGGMGFIKKKQIEIAQEAGNKDRREAAAEIKRESRGKEDSMTSGQKQSMEESKDEEMRKKMKTAPTTKTEMGKPFAKGGMTASSRADGCAVKGKTRGKMI